MKSEPDLNHQETINLYQRGQSSFERGQYREAVDHFRQAQSRVEDASALGGEIQLWLVMAYDAVGERDAAIALCRQLGTHPDRTTRKQSQRVLYILEAPKLKLRPEWLTQIPDLSDVSDRNSTPHLGNATLSKRTASIRSPKPLDPVDLNQVNTQENGFVGVALAAIVLLLGTLWWLK